MANLGTIYDHNCTGCPLHEKEGVTCISGAGNITNPRVIVVGDAPSKDEASTGVGYWDQRSALLIEVLKGAGFSVGPKGDVFATYACKCYPEGKVKVKDMKTCAEKFLMAELDLFKPDLILVLGKNAQLAVTGDNSSIAKTHGKILPFERGGWTAQVIPLDHPFTVLSNPAKLDQWAADMKRAAMVFHSEGSPYWDDSKLSRFDFQVITSVRKFKAVAKELIAHHKGDYLAIDIEASGIDEDIYMPDYRVFSLQFGIVDPDDKKRNDSLPVYILPLQSEQWACTAGKDMWLNKMRGLLNEFLSPRYFKIVAHNGKYDLKGLRRIGVDKVYLDRDTMILWADMHGEAPMSLKEICYQITDLGGYEEAMTAYFKEHGSYDAPPDLLTTYGCLDIVVTRHLMYEHLHGIMTLTEADK
jgi:DNA polymerase